MISFASLKLKTPTEKKTFDFKNHKIEVDTFMPTESKLDIIYITLQKSAYENIYNPLLLDVIFHLNLVYMYTNITFTEAQRKDELKLFDLLNSNGFFDEFLPLIKEDYEELKEMMNELIENTLKYNNSAASVIKHIIEDLPSNAEAARTIVDNFDPSKYAAVVDFAKAVNNNQLVDNK